MCHASCSHALRPPTAPSLSWHSSCTFVVFLTRASTSIVQRAAAGGRTRGGRGSVEKFFSLVFPAHTQRKRYFIEFFVAQKRVCAENCCCHKVFHFIFHSCPFASYSCHAPRPAEFPAAHLLCCWQVFFKNFASFCRFCVDFRQPDCAPFPLSFLSFSPFLSSSPSLSCFPLEFSFCGACFF